MKKKAKRKQVRVPKPKYKIGQVIVFNPSSPKQMVIGRAEYALSRKEWWYFNNDGATWGTQEKDVLYKL